MPDIPEDKPPFTAIPPFLLDRIGALSGAPVAAGAVAWGGFSPSANYLLTLADGRRARVRSHKMRYHDADGKVLGLLIAFQELDAAA